MHALNLCTRLPTCVPTLVLAKALVWDPRDYIALFVSVLHCDPHGRDDARHEAWTGLYAAALPLQSPCRSRKPKTSGVWAACARHGVTR